MTTGTIAKTSMMSALAVSTSPAAFAQTTTRTGVLENVWLLLEIIHPWASTRLQLCRVNFSPAAAEAAVERYKLETNEEVGQEESGIYGADVFTSAIGTVATAELDDDGDVDGADLAAWESSFGVGAGADADADGDSNGADFLAWQRQFTGPGPLAGVAVSEPSGMWTIVSGLSIVLIIRQFRLFSPRYGFSCAG